MNPKAQVKIQIVKNIDINLKVFCTKGKQPTERIE